MVLRFFSLKRIKHFLLIISAVFFSGVLLNAEKLVILHFNDLHARIDNLAKIAFIAQINDQSNPDVLLISLGDNFSGSPIVDQCQPQGEPVLNIFNKIGLDLLVIGNHEFDYGAERLQTFLQKGKFTALLANAQVPETFKTLLLSYYPYQTSVGTKIIFVPLLQVDEDGYPSTHPDAIKGFSFYEPLAFAENFIHLKEKSDYLVALTHLGTDQDVQLAERYNFFPLIIGGHSHTTIEQPLKVGNSQIVQAGDNGHFLGRLEIEFNDQKKVCALKYRLIDLKKVESRDQEIEKLITEYNKNPYFKTVLIKNDFEFLTKESVGYLVTDAMRSVVGADICLFNAGGVRRSRLAKEITIKDVYDTLPFRNELVVYKMKTSEIRKLILKYFLRRQQTPDLFISGAKYLIRKIANDQFEVLLSGENDQPLDENECFQVVINSYMAANDSKDLPQNGKSSYLIIGDALKKYLEVLAGKGQKLPDYNNIKRIRVE